MKNVIKVSTLLIWLLLAPSSLLHAVTADELLEIHKVTTMYILTQGYAVITQGFLQMLVMRDNGFNIHL